MATQWIQVLCPDCEGHGVVSQYSVSDFEGPTDCRKCAGSGLLWLSDKDRLADYPGGQGRGSWPGRYAELRAQATGRE
jgi:DnaJ-class molecular chaperone